MTTVSRGDRLVVETAGGGGLRDGRRARRASLLDADVANRKVSAAVGEQRTMDLPTERRDEASQPASYQHLTCLRPAWLEPAPACCRTAVRTLLQPGAVAAQYPARTIRIVIPFGPGSATDAVMRVLAPHVSERLGQPILIDPKPGADGAVSASEVARAEPDGYTLGVGSGGPMAAVPALRKHPPYDVARDFTPITDIGRYTVFLYVNNELPVTSFREFVDYVKANPGKVAYGTGNPSGIVAFAQMNSLLGLEHAARAVRSAPQVMPDLLDQPGAGADGSAGGGAASCRSRASCARSSPR